MPVSETGLLEPAVPASNSTYASVMLAQGCGTSERHKPLFAPARS